MISVMKVVSYALIKVSYALIKHRYLKCLVYSVVINVRHNLELSGGRV